LERFPLADNVKSGPVPSSSVLGFFIENPLLSPVRLAAWSMLTKILARKDLAIVAVDHVPERASTYELIRQTRQETSMVLLDSEAFSICAQVRATAKVPGEIAEVGVYRGGSGRLICEEKGGRALHLFDTFDGLPPATEWDPKFREGGFASSLEQVQAYLQRFPGVQFHKGLFPESARGLEDLRFSFVHLDVDLYRSTLSGLEWFYPRMSRGAVLISHDYTIAKGVRKAFDEFFADKPECLIELSGSQVAFVKL
jgi:O-methyltransferase